MARLYIPVIKTQDGVDTTVYYLRDQASADCATDLQVLLTLINTIVNSTTLTNSQKISQLNALFLTDVPANLPGMEWVDRDCNGVYIETTDADYIPADGGDGGGEQPLDWGGTVLDAPNDPDFLNLGYEWLLVNGEWLARIFNQASPTATSGNQLMCFMDGDDDPFIGSIPADFYVQPGTTLAPLLAMGPSVEMYPDGYSRKSQQYLYIGNPPTA